MTPRRAVVLLAAVLFLCNLWGYDLWAPDEPYFAEGAREMIADGEWFVPHVNGMISTDKPPLFFWLIALFSLPFGEVFSFTARLPSVLAGLGTLLLTIRLGRRYGDPRTAALAGLILCTLVMFWEKSRWSQIDATLCFCIWVALSSFVARRAGEWKGLGPGLLFWAAVALAVLAKGPIGLLLPVGIVAITGIVDRFAGPAPGPVPGGEAHGGFQPGASLSVLLSPLGILLFVGLLAGWMVAATLGTGGDYSVYGALREHFIDRSISGMHHKQPFWYYLKVMPPYLLPWTGIVPAGVLLAMRRRVTFDRFLLVAAFFVLIVFTISTEKRELYALPSLPAFALLTARGVGHVLGWGEEAATRISRRWVLAGQAITAVLLVLGAAALVANLGDHPQIPFAVVVAVAISLGVGGIAALGMLLRGRLLAGVLAPAFGFVGLYLLVASLIYPAMDPVKSARDFSEQLAEASADSRAAGHPVLAFNLGNSPEAFALYSKGVYTEEVWKHERLVEHLQNEEVVYAAINAEVVDLLPPELVDRMRVLERTRLSRRDVWLVANR
ncbi:hypothetical protein ABI59_09090 [Acidobacteria bacterium Mor1]|nr:hypothetical protein ABI59_09090 [Acidobacteria bacterium Mor1]